MSKQKLVRVLLVGRMNVGKSTLFNRLSSSVKSLMLDYEGVTRDFVSDVVTWQGRSFELVDSGGISLQKELDPLVERVRLLGLSLVESADVVIFVCDGKCGITKQDSEIANFLHKQGKPVIVAINKGDTTDAKEHQFDFSRMGFKAYILISALHGIGIADLFDALYAAFPDQLTDRGDDEVAYKIALLGKPNVGKSSLMNLLLGTTRSIVADLPGTTREQVTSTLRFYQETLQIADTPGIRKKRVVEHPLEKLMVKSALRAVDNADIVLLLADAAAGQLSDQELKLAFYVFEQNKGLVLLVNKSDLIDELGKAMWEESFDSYPLLAKKIPILFISCESGKNVNKVLPLVKEVWARYIQELGEDEVDATCKIALRKTPHYHGGHMLRLYQVRVVKFAPLTLVFHVNDPSWFGQSQCAFFENILRSTYDLLGVPVVIIPRKGA